MKNLNLNLNTQHIETKFMLNFFLNKIYVKFFFKQNLTNLIIWVLCSIIVNHKNP